jgi:hypothetical protein
MIESGCSVSCSPLASRLSLAAFVTFAKFAKFAKFDKFAT